MKIEEMWQKERSAFLSQVRKAADVRELLSQYGLLMEQLKMQTISEYPYEENLRQMIILLFQSALQGAEFALVQGNPTVVPQDSTGAKQEEEPSLRVWNLLHPASFWPQILLLLRKLLAGPILSVALLAVGMIYCLAKWPQLPYCILIMGAASALIICSFLLSRRKPVLLTAKPTLRTEYLDTFISNQTRLLDQQISDLKMLLQDMSEPVTERGADIELLKLCQQIWGTVNSAFPVESAYYSAEKLLLNSGAEWVPFSPENRGMYDVMPTRKESRTVFPAVRSRETGSLLSKGQYLEKRAE